MSGALPDPLLLAAVVFGLTGVYALYAAACCACRWAIQARRDAKPPVPGNATPSPTAAAPPLAPPARRQPPAPGPHSAIPPHDTGGVDYGITRWKCGCILSFDALGRVTGTTLCAQPTDLDEWLKDITS